jgi:hypothetical protein
VRVLIGEPDPRVVEILARTSSEVPPPSAAQATAPLVETAAAASRLGEVLQRLEGSRPPTPAPTLPTPGRELPAFPDIPPSLGGLRGLAALASPASFEEISSPTAPPTPEPTGDDLAERLERLLRREAHRHGIEVEP